MIPDEKCSRTRLGRFLQDFVISNKITASDLRTRFGISAIQYRAWVVDGKIPLFSTVEGISKKLNADYDYVFDLVWKDKADQLRRDKKFASAKMREQNKFCKILTKARCLSGKNVETVAIDIFENKDVYRQWESGEAIPDTVRQATLIEESLGVKYGALLSPLLDEVQRREEAGYYAREDKEYEERTKKR